MHVEGAGNSIPPLRLVHPPEARPIEVVTRVQQAPRPADSYNFESVYTTQLHRVPRTPAHARLEQLRASLVAGRTPVPVYFTDPAVRRSNPYDPSYMRIAPTPTEINTTAVEHISTPHPAGLPL
jgi:hypothetical protein